MKKGQQFILLRYSNTIVPNTIEQHKAIIDELGYCWFGKIGVVPSAKIRKAILDEEEPCILLYTRGIVHECRLLDISEKKPAYGCPAYYETEGIIPSVYFKLLSIDPVAIKELERYRVISTGSPLLDAVGRSMTSYFFAEWTDGTARTNVEKKIEKAAKKEKRELLPPNDCVYRKEGKCTLKSCINYKYECDRPSRCLSQKR